MSNSRFYKVVKKGKFSELSWIDFLKKTVKKNPKVLVSIGDDCAVVKGEKKTYILTSDLSIEDVHFSLAKSDYRTIGKRAIARAFSDIAACAGSPEFVGVSLGLPKYVTYRALKRLWEGIMFMCSKYKASILGGDTARSDKLFLDIWVVGNANKVVLRREAKEGDYIFVSGVLGKLKFTEVFYPKIDEAKELVNNYKINSMIDISDGFIIDLFRILKESKKGAIIWKNMIPVYKDINDIFRGEDYQLIFTVDKEEKKINELIGRFYLVGIVKDSKFGYWMEEGEVRRRIEVKGYLHF
ncbi:MAG: thiamine-phosphate kinase [Candidatus Omnitrophica bacterium]|nr:thiamine-phosphate kinase [Candidatus Omnitrophota bacterium]